MISAEPEVDPNRPATGRRKRPGWLPASSSSDRAGASATGWQRRARRVVGPIVFVIAWWFAVRIGILDQRFVPTPEKIARVIGGQIQDGTFHTNLLISARRAFEGLLFGACAGTLAGCVAGMSRLGEDAADPIIQMLRTIPFVALTPLFVLWFGIGETPKVALVTVATFFPLYLNTYNGIRNVDARLVEAARSFGVGRIGLVREVIFPAALPQILVGLRMAMGFSWLALVVAEQVNADSGIGYLLQTAQYQFDTPGVIAAVVTYAAMGILTDAMVRVLEGRLLRWRVGFTGS